MSAEPAGLQLTYAPIGTEHLAKLKLLNSVLFPIKYQDQLYKQCILFEHTHGAFCGGELVGAIACRLERKDGCVHLYILTLGVLAAYRGHGIGTELLSAAVKLAAADPAVAAAQLHVQTSNADAIAFYQRRGFQLGGVLCNYYRRLSPPDAVELYRALHAGYRHGPPASKAAGGEATPGGSASLGSSVRQQTHQHVQPG